MKIVFDLSYFLTNIPSLDAGGCDVTLSVTDAKQYMATEGLPSLLHARPGL